MSFHSDNETGVAPEIFAALAAVNDGTVMPYGNDQLTASLNESLSRIFGTEVSAFLVVTGTASNVLALSTMTPPYGGIYCHEKAHILVDECGGPEFYTGGARLLPMAGADGKLHADDLAVVLREQRDDVHYIKPSALSLTQVTESGTIYTPEEVTSLCRLAKDKGMHVHMDGTRFANAVASLGCHPADITWKAGVDVLSFGATKNGAIAAEAVVFFNQTLAQDFSARRKRGGHLPSKMRFMAAQFNAYLENDRWLGYATHANRMAEKLAVELNEVPDVEFSYPVQANLIFADMSQAMLKAIQDAGYQPDYWLWENGRCEVRFVTAFNTSEQDIEHLMQVIRSL